MNNVSVSHLGCAVAFAAGVASFLSPCVLPLIPGYVSLISGLSLEDMAEHVRSGAAARKAGINSALFVLGFSVVFTFLGGSASALGRALSSALPALTRAAGIFIALFGLHTAGLVPIRLLYYEKRFSFSGIAPGYLGAFLMGLAFACGWTPCIGPILGAILALAATQKTAGEGMLLLFLYSLGLGIPFILAGLGVNAFMQFFARYKRFIRWGERIAGLLLALVGVLVFFQHLDWISRYLPAWSVGRSLPS